MKNPVDRLIKIWDGYNFSWGKSQMRLELRMAQKEVEQLKRRMFLEGFKASAEGFNGEHPTMDDEKIWGMIREDYNKVK
jgi:hypothetical protein